MNKSMLAGIGIGVAAALGVAAVASMNVFNRGPQYAQVVSATPIKESIKTPRQECRNVTMTHRRPVQDENRLTGSVLGAVAGGVIGHQFGGGVAAMSPRSSARWAVATPVIRSRAKCRQETLTPRLSSVVKRCMTNRKKCWDMTSHTKLATSKGKSAWTKTLEPRSHWMTTVSLF